MRLLPILLAALVAPLSLRADTTPSQDLLESAYHMFERGEYQGALSQYTNFLKEHPKDSRKQAVQMMIADCMRKISYAGESKADNSDVLLFRDDKVVKEYEKVIKMGANNAYAESAQFRLNEMLYNAGAYNEASRSWDNFLDRYPDSYLKAEALFAQAQTLSMLGRWDELGQTIEELIRINPYYEENDDMLYLRGVSSFAKLHYSKANESFEKIKNITPAVLYYSGKSLMGLAKPLVAARKFQDLLQKFPSDVLAEESQYLLAESFFSAGDYSAAISEFGNFLQAYPKSAYAPAANYKIGLGQFLKENYFDARTSLQVVIANSPQSEFAAWSQYMIGETYLKQKQLKEASFAYGDMANHFPTHPYAGNALFKLSWCAYVEKNYQEAEAYLKKMLMNYPGHSLTAYAQVLLGNALVAQEEYVEAAISYQKAIDISFPSDIAESALALANRTMLLSKNYGALVSAHHLLLNNYPPSANPWRALTYLFIAEGYFNNGLYSEAINIYKSILRLYPVSQAAVFAQDGISWSLFKLGKHKEAGFEREKIQNYQEESAPAPESLKSSDYEQGNILFNQKKYPEALEKYEKFMKENAGHTLVPEAKYRAGMCYTQLGYHGQAIDTWEELRKNFKDSPAAAKASWKIADTYFKAAKYDQASGVYREILRSYPNDPEASLAQLRIAQGFYSAKQAVQSIEEFKMLILNYPDHSRAKDGLDFLSSLLEQPASKAPAMEALRAIAKSLGERNLVGSETQFRIAQSYFDAKDYASAIKELENLSGKFLSTASLADKEYYLGESYYQTGKFIESSASFERLTKNFPEDAKMPFALFRLGSAYFKIDKFLESGVAFDRLAKNFPRSEYAPNALYNAAISYKKAKRWEDAKTTLTAFMRSYPEKAKESQAEDELVGLYLETKDYAAANVVLENMRKGLPPESDRYGELSVRVAENLVLSGSMDEAIKEHEKTVASMNPKNNWRLTAAVKLVSLYEKAEQWTSAVKLYEDIIRNAPKPEWVSAAKARLDYIRGNHPEAFLK